MTSLKFHLSSSSSAILHSSNSNRISSCNLRLPIKSLRSASLTVHSLHNPPSQSFPPQSQPSIPSEYISSVGSPPLSFSTVNLSQWNFTHRHIIILNVIACSVAFSATWLFLSAIPTLLAFKRAAESLEKLMDATREELPDTMAAIRLSGMEISDLTMELSDLGQELTQGVKSSTRAVRVAEEKLRGLTNLTPPPAPPKDGDQSQNSDKGTSSGKDC